MEAGHLGEFARQQRRSQRLSQVEVAELADVSERFVRDFEGGKTSVRIDKVVEVLSVLGFDLEPTVHKAQIEWARP